MELAEEVVHVGVYLGFRAVCAIGTAAVRAEPDQKISNLTDFFENPKICEVLELMFSQNFLPSVLFLLPMGARHGVSELLLSIVYHAHSVHHG